MVGQVARDKGDKATQGTQQHHSRGEDGKCDQGDEGKQGKHIRSRGSAGHETVFLKCPWRRCPYTETCGRWESDSAFTIYY